jgi:hypothetical protein
LDKGLAVVLFRLLFLFAANLDFNPNSYSPSSPSFSSLLTFFGAIT